MASESFSNSVLKFGVFQGNLMAKHMAALINTCKTALFTISGNYIKPGDLPLLLLFTFD